MLTQILTITFGLTFIAFGIAGLSGKFRPKNPRMRMSVPAYVPLGLLFLVNAFEQQLLDLTGLQPSMVWIIYAPLFVWMLYWVFVPPGGAPKPGNPPSASPRSRNKRG